MDSNCWPRTSSAAPARRDALSGKRGRAMNARSFAASVFLIAAMLCVARVAVDGINHDAPIREHARAASHHLGNSRPARPNPTAVSEHASLPAAPSAAGRAAPVEPHESLSPFLPPVFVPPRA